jgi:Ulp1 family protease
VEDAVKECNNLPLDESTDSIYHLTLHDTLQCAIGQWLGDGSIDAYIKYLNMVSRRMMYNHVVLTAQDSQRLKLNKTEELRFSAGVFKHITLTDLCNKFDRVVMPVNTSSGMHWSVAVLTKGNSPSTITFLWYDSLAYGVDKAFKEGLERAFKNDHKTLQAARIVQCPRQPNNHDCGAFACWNIEEILAARKTGGTISYDPNTGRSYRLLMVYRVLGCIRR